MLCDNSAESYLNSKTDCFVIKWKNIEHRNSALFQIKSLLIMESIV